MVSFVHVVDPDDGAHERANRRPAHLWHVACGRDAEGAPCHWGKAMGTV